MKDKEIKVCHVAHQTWPTVCGSVSRLENILASQRKSGINPFVISSPFQASHEPNSEKEEHNGTTYYRHNINTVDKSGIKNKRTLLERLGRLASIIPFTLRIIDICKEENPDIIHAHATFVMGIPALIAGAILKKKVVYEMRSTWEDDISGGFLIPTQKTLIKKIEGLIGRRSDFIVSVSNGILGHYFKTTPEKSKTIHNCVPLPQIADRENPNSGKYSFGYIGSIVYYEGLEVLIEASRLLSEKRNDFTVHIYGDGKEKTSLERIISQTKNHNIKLHGRIEFSKINEAYSKIDCIVLPRKDLPITQKVAGLKPVEAFAYKKLVIASNVGGMRELFTDKVHGFLFTPESPAELASLMDKALSGSLDSERIKSQAFEHYQKDFTLESMGEKYSNIYHQLISEKQITL